MTNTALKDLIRINTNDMLEAFGLGSVRLGRGLLTAACYWPARRFALTVLEFDRRVEQDGLQAAANWGLQQFAAEFQLLGAEHLPQAGPVLFVANHPGITDTLALFGAHTRFPGGMKIAVFPFSPTSERLAEWLWGLANEKLADARVHVPWVRVYETLHPVESVAEFTRPA